MGTKTIHKRIIIIAVILAIVAAAILIYFHPIQVIDSDELDNWKIQFLAASNDSTLDLKEITEFDGEAILSYLAGCSRTRALSEIGPVEGEAVSFMIVLHITGPESSVLIECNSRRCSASYNGAQYTIQNSKDVSSQLLSMIYD